MLDGLSLEGELLKMIGRGSDQFRVVVSGLYITEVKSVRGGIPPVPKKKKGFFARMYDSAQSRLRANNTAKK